MSTQTMHPPARRFELWPMEAFPHEFMSDAITENGIEQWAIFERRYSAKWILVARCPDERCATTIVATLNARVSDQGRSETCVAICSVDTVCAVCNGLGYLEHEPGTNSYGAVCPKAKELREQFNVLPEWEAEF
jgi:hypothetical protein